MFSESPREDWTVVVRVRRRSMGGSSTPSPSARRRGRHRAFTPSPTGSTTTSSGGDYLSRIAGDHAYEPPLRDWVLAYPTRTGNPNDRLQSFDVVQAFDAGRAGVRTDARHEPARARAHPLSVERDSPPVRFSLRGTFLNACFPCRTAPRCSPVRVARASGARHLAHGTIGRVVRERDGGFDVHVVGVGEVWFARDGSSELRRPGQVRFAERREAAWAALRPCVVLEAVVGSQAGGLANDGSDTDTRGAFALPFWWSCGLNDAPTDLVSADGSHTFWELTKTVKQALRADPNTLELLFVPSVRATDELGAWLLEARDAFVSRAIFGSFGRYALSQLDKLTRAHRLSEHRDRVLDWLRDEGLLARRVRRKARHRFPARR